MKTIEIRDLNFWQLACILGSAMGFPAMLIGGQVAALYGAGTAMISICVGNLILWLVGLGVVSMSETKNNAIENIKQYLGGKSGLLAALVLVLAFLIWYTIQIKGVVFVDLFTTNRISATYSKILLGAALGFFVSLLSVGGIRLISWTCVISLPLLLCFAIFMIATSSSTINFRGTWGYSYVGIIMIMLTWLPGIVNLPTFFRHSCSKADSFLALSIMTIFHIFFQITAVLSGFSDLSDISSYIHSSDHFLISFLISSFIILFFICINLVNIYFASAGWDALISIYTGSIKYVVIGLLGTLAYVLLQLSSSFLHSPMQSLERALTSFISTLGIVLLIDYLISVIVKHRPRSYEKFWSSICWLTGCITTVIVEVRITTMQHYSIVAGIIASLLAFLIVVFVEETIWSFKNLNELKHKP